MAFKKGKSGNPAGKPHGPNKSTKRVREAIAKISDDMADDFKEWLMLTATGDPGRGLKPDPKGAADIYLKAIEYHIPKLARTEHIGEDGGPVRKVVEVKFHD